MSDLSWWSEARTCSEKVLNNTLCSDHLLNLTHVSASWWVYEVEIFICTHVPIFAISESSLTAHQRYRLTAVTLALRCTTRLYHPTERVAWREWGKEKLALLLSPGVSFLWAWPTWWEIVAKHLPALSYQDAFQSQRRGQGLSSDSVPHLPPASSSIWFVAVRSFVCLFFKRLSLSVWSIGIRPLKWLPWQ